MDIQLTSAQQKVVEHNEGPLLVVAGPGSGKTRVVTERIRRLLTKTRGHFRILALTFTNLAANEMKGRLRDVPDIQRRTFMGTFHAFCTEVIASRGKHIGLDPMPLILQSVQERKQILLSIATSDPAIQRKLQTAGNTKEQDRLLQNWLDKIAQFKSNLLTPDAVENDLDRAIYEAYDAQLRASGFIDFEDLLLLTYRLFQEAPQIADFYRRQYKYICVDEGQDLNEAQYQVLRALCGTSYRNVMIVGDPHQSIFAWTGADPKYLNLFASDFDAKIIRMDENFRSSRAVMEVAQKLDGGTGANDNYAIAGAVRLILASDEQSEAIAVLDEIQNLRDHGHSDIEGDVTLNRCAVLGRNRYVFVALEHELTKRGWPYFRQIGVRQESESDLLQDFELCLRIFANPQDQLHLNSLLRRWNIDESAFRSAGQSSIKLFKRLAKLTNRSSQTAVLAAIDKLGETPEDIQFPKSLDALDASAAHIKETEERAQVTRDIETWRKHWDFYLRLEPGATKRSLVSFLSKIALGLGQQSQGDGLALLTIHSAKGQEFDVVFVMGMVEGVFPDYRAQGKALEEEARSMYVAASRARRLLYFSYPKVRMMPWGSEKVQTPSRYLRMLELIK